MEMNSKVRGRKRAVIKTPSFLTATIPGNTLYGGTAEIISNGIRSNRTCTIQISNHLNVPLTDPQYYCYNGGPYYNLPTVIQPGSREACVFSKDPNLPLGVIGVITYQLGDLPERIAVMFAVPYNQLELRNHFGVALIDVIHPSKPSEVEGMNQEISLFKRMYQDPQFYDRPGRNHCIAHDCLPMMVSGENFHIRGTMSDRGKAIIKLNIAYSC